MDANNIWISPLRCLLSSLLLLRLAAIVGSSSLESDLTALLKFRCDCDPTGRLATWNGSAPVASCGSWYGVTCTEGRVTRVVLEGLGLSGPIAALTQLDQLRILSLKSNNLSGPIPDLTRLSHLKLLFLSDNAFSGPIPTSLASLPRLYRLDLSSNHLTGLVPAATLRSLARLLTLRLSDNRLSGPISSLSLPNLQDLNLSSNLLSGAIPSTLASFPASAFTGNPSLCGAPLSSPCTNLVSDPATSSSAPLPPATAIITSFPSTKPQTGAPIIEPRSSPTTSRRISREAVVFIVVADVIVLVVVSGVLFCYFWRKFRFSARSPSRLQEGEKIVYSTRPYAATAGGSSSCTAAAGDGVDFERGAQMVFLEGAKRFELEDLLRASAEMLGKGGYGTAYKAVLGDGSAVAVKRLRDIHVIGKREFEQQMEALGQLRHPNLVQLKAYYFAGDEKLLVYEFMHNGSLFALLHGNRGPGRMPLDWTTRIRIAAGVAKGLAFIHQATKLAHGNVKSTNVLLDKEGNARLADVGLAMLGPPAAAGRCGGYRAPEAPPDGRRAWSSQRADVYAFGVVVLELLTGRPADGGGGVVDLPRWAASVVREEWTAEVFDLELMRYKGIEEEMVAMLQVAMACTAASPDQRPGIGHVLRTIEEMRGGDVSPSHGSYDSISDSPSVSEDAAGSQ